MVRISLVHGQLQKGQGHAGTQRASTEPELRLVDIVAAAVTVHFAQR